MAGTRCGAGFLGEGGGASEVRARTATGDDDNFCTTPFFLIGAVCGVGGVGGGRAGVVGV